MRRYNVEAVCTTDDPVDTLEYHEDIAKSGFEIKVLPTWRPDKAMAIESPEAYKEYIVALEGACGMGIGTFKELIEALRAP